MQTVRSVRARSERALSHFWRPPEVEWFKNIRSPSTKRAYENAIKDFMMFAGSLL
jgi:hypothetical protein